MVVVNCMVVVKWCVMWYGCSEVVCNVVWW